jgi:HSP20 family protein
MANITRFEPFRELARFEPFGDLDEMFKRLAQRPVFRRLDAGPQIKMDVKEADGEYRVKAEIPGVNKEDIHVSVEGGRVTIRAEVRKEKEEKKGERVIHSERSYGMASRTFTLENEIDESNVKAKYADGVLEVTLPKKAGKSAREISIS